MTAQNTLDTSTLDVLVSGIGRNKFHNGGRLRWGPDGKLYAGTGDAQNSANAQNRNSLNGKVLRINPDGSVPSDNPFGNHVWSYGHRNVQGLAFDSQGRLWEQEFGNSIMDETNLIQRGGNYGWPSCEGTSGNCGGFIAPKATVSVSAGSCSGIAIVRDKLYVACQRGTRLYRYTISGSSLTDRQQFFQGTYGRLRTVEPSPSGGMWMATSNGGDKDSTPNNSNNRIFHLTLGS
jgi:glucose/arabinose dehydrogenase